MTRKIRVGFLGVKLVRRYFCLKLFERRLLLDLCALKPPTKSMSTFSLIPLISHFSFVNCDSLAFFCEFVLFPKLNACFFQP